MHITDNCTETIVICLYFSVETILQRNKKARPEQKYLRARETRLRANSLVLRSTISDLKKISQSVDSIRLQALELTNTLHQQVMLHVLPHAQHQMV